MSEGIEVSAALALRAAAGSLDAAERRAQAAEERRAARAPFGLSGANGASIGANGTAVIVVGGPSQGHHWFVRRLGVASGSAPITGSTLAGVADVFVGRLAASAPGPARDWVWSFAQLPAGSVFSNEQITVSPQCLLYVVISGATSGEAVVVSWAVLEAYASAGALP